MARKEKALQESKTEEREAAETGAETDARAAAVTGEAREAAVTGEAREAAAETEARTAAVTGAETAAEATETAGDRIEAEIEEKIQIQPEPEFCEDFISLLRRGKEADFTKSNKPEDSLFLLEIVQLIVHQMFHGSETSPMRPYVLDATMEDEPRKCHVIIWETENKDFEKIKSKESCPFMSKRAWTKAVFINPKENLINEILAIPFLVTNTANILKVRNGFSWEIAMLKLDLLPNILSYLYNVDKSISVTNKEKSNDKYSRTILLMPPTQLAHFKLLPTSDNSAQWTKEKYAPVTKNSTMFSLDVENIIEPIRGTCVKEMEEETLQEGTTPLLTDENNTTETEAEKAEEEIEERAETRVAGERESALSTVMTEKTEAAAEREEINSAIETEAVADSANTTEITGAEIAADLDRQVEENNTIEEITGTEGEDLIKEIEKIEEEMRMKIENEELYNEIQVIFDELIQDLKKKRNRDIFLTRFRHLLSKSRTANLLNHVKNTVREASNLLCEKLPPDGIITAVAVPGDLKAMKIKAPYLFNVSDQFTTRDQNGKLKAHPSLKELSIMYLKKDIQSERHDSCDDAAATLKLMELKLTTSIEYGNEHLMKTIKGNDEFRQTEGTSAIISTKETIEVYKEEIRTKVIEISKDTHNSNSSITYYEELSREQIVISAGQKYHEAFNTTITHFTSQHDIKEEDIDKTNEALCSTMGSNSLAVILVINKDDRRALSLFSVKM